MRVSTSAITNQLILGLTRNYARRSEYSLQLSSGKRITSFADDPRGVGSIFRYESLQTANDQYLRNLGSARTYLEATDLGLQDVVGNLNTLRTILIRETGALANDESNSTTAVEVEGLRDSLLNLMNQTVEGAFLFGGYQTAAQPFQLFEGHVGYNGDANAPEVQIGPNLRLPVTIPGSELLGSERAILAGRIDLLPRVDGATALADLNRGSGVALGTIELSDGVGGSVVVDLSGASTVQDVLDAINGSGGSISARISDDESGITLDGPGPLTVAEVAGGSTAADLGILGTDSGNTLVGTDVRAQLTESTDFSEIPSLDGKLPLGALRFTVGTTVTDVDLSAANNLADVRAAIQGLVPDMDLRVEEGSIQLVLDRPESFMVSSPPDDPTASLLGLAGDASPARLFELYEEMIAALEAGDRDALRQGLVEVEDVIANVLDLNVQVGSRQNILDQTETLLLQRQQELKIQRGRVEDADIVEAASQLSLAEAAYQAALSATARIFDLSLANYL